MFSTFPSSEKGDSTSLFEITLSRSSNEFRQRTIYRVASHKVSRTWRDFRLNLSSILLQLFSPKVNKWNSKRKVLRVGRHTKGEDLEIRCGETRRGANIFY